MIHMKTAAAMQVVGKGATLRVSVPVSAENLHLIEAQAERAGVSRSAFLARLLQLGLEAEQQRYEQFAKKIRQYRDCPDETEADRLGDEIGEMIFGR
jgi:Zn-dependent peptidase ImmA (M78 family)